MSTVQEIETAIQKLKPQEIHEVAGWLQELREELWDKQIDADAKAGRLDKLMEEAKQDYLAGRCKPLPRTIAPLQDFGGITMRCRPKSESWRIRISSFSKSIRNILRFALNARSRNCGLCASVADIGLWPGNGMTI